MNFVKRNLGGLTALILVLLFSACTLTSNNNSDLNSIDERKGALSSFIINSTYPVNNSTGIEVGKAIEINFSYEINPASLNNSSVKLYNADTFEVIEVKLVLDSTKKKLYAKPIFTTYPVENDIYTKGMRPDTLYRVYISKTIKDINGRTLAEDKILYYKTRTLDYGIYWFDGNGNSEKFVKGDPSLFYDKTKPVVIYAHGWESSTSKRDYWREVPYIWNDKYTKNVNTGTLWKTKGYNTGVFYWNQFADEGEVKDAEAKIWKGDNGQKQMRYRMQNESYYSYSTAKSVHELFYDCYVDALSDNTSGYIRIAGHSLGNQLATALTYKISDNVYYGRISSHYMPKRVALLDPFWSKDGKAYLNGKWTGEQARIYIKTIIERHNTAVEQYKTTAIGGAIVGDENIGMREMTAFYRVWPDFIGLQDAALQHGYAVLWYFWSVSAGVSGEYYTIGANNDDATVRKMMNYGKFFKYYWYNEGNGTMTGTPHDDYFKRKSGVSTW